MKINLVLCTALAGFLISGALAQTESDQEANGDDAAQVSLQPLKPGDAGPDESAPQEMFEEEWENSPVDVLPTREDESADQSGS